VSLAPSESGKRKRINFCLARKRPDEAGCKGTERNLISVGGEGEKVMAGRDRMKKGGEGIFYCSDALTKGKPSTQKVEA